MSNKRAAKRKSALSQRYAKFDHIDGRHEYRDRIPDGFVDYMVRTRRGAKVAFFNYELAKEMGLIPKDHPSKMNARLEERILHSFGLQIINEFDLENKTPIPQEDVRRFPRMATRYLQLQHPDKTGTTSGDGRSMWNGQVSHNGVTWDVSSCGTGATRLSPATAIHNKFFETGDPQVSYGCGYADLSDGISAAMMSEIFNRNGVPTERTLAVLEYPNSMSVNVRASQSLLRPSHLFNHLKQGNYDSLKGGVDFYIDRMVRNGTWPKTRGNKARYEDFGKRMAITFGKMAARFESDYIFVWLDWDGDNILMDGGILDYGSVRQFGLFHHEYRYDDSDRWSTTIPEQKEKARYLVQTFAQIRDYLIRGSKRPIAKFAKDPLVKLFEKEFERETFRRLVHKIGFETEEREWLMDRRKARVKSFRKLYSYFERMKAAKGQYKVPDGITWDAVYCMRDVLRELPVFLLSHHRQPTPEEFMEIMASTYAKKADRKLTPYKVRMIRSFLKEYEGLVSAVEREFAKSRDQVLLELTMRSSVINRYDRITGESIIWITDRILKARKSMSFDRAQKLMDDFVLYQKLLPDEKSTEDGDVLEKRKSQRVFSQIIELIHELRDSI